MMHLGVLSKCELIGFNQVRICLEALTLADIATGNGANLCGWARSIDKLSKNKSKWK